MPYCITTHLNALACSKAHNELIKSVELVMPSISMLYLMTPVVCVVGSNIHNDDMDESCCVNVVNQW